VRIKQITIHNFRSIKDVCITPANYTMIIGENNVGTTNIIVALRMLYEDGGFKYKPAIDFPKFDTDDKESWIEIAYETTSYEQESLKDEYKTIDNTLKVRRYFASSRLSGFFCKSLFLLRIEF